MNNDSNHRITRRQMLRLAGFGTLFGALASGGDAAAASCLATPPQTKGPFYPENNLLTDQNNDLTQRAGATAAPLGTVVYIRGTVVDSQCRPVDGALVEIWQAAASGRYQHTLDNSGLALDPNFSYWGEITTNVRGEYAFKTIIPGHYPADANWDRPPHIHFKVSRVGYHELVTQMYFSPDSFSDPAAMSLVRRLNDADPILQAVPRKASVVVDFKEVGVGTEIHFERRVSSAGKTTVVKSSFVPAPGERVGDFAIHLTSVR